MEQERRPKGQRVAIVGSRYYPDPNQVREFVRALPPDTTVVSGGAMGVDTWAELEATKRGLVTAIFKPQYAKFGSRAPIVRNEAIVDFCDRLVAFWNGRSKGTLNALYLARKKHKAATIYKPRTPHYVKSESQEALP